MISEFGNIATRSNNSRSFVCKPSPREAATAPSLSKDVISKAPMLVPSKDQHESLVADCHSESCSQIGLVGRDALSLKRRSGTSIPCRCATSPEKGAHDDNRD